MAKNKKSKKVKQARYFDPRDFFPHMDALYSDEAILPSFPENMDEFAAEQTKAANPAYWMHMGQMMSHSAVGAPWLWYGMMLGTMEAMRASGKSSKKIEKRHKEAVEAVRKFTKHVAGAKAVKPPKKKKKAETFEEKQSHEVSNALDNVLHEARDGQADDLKRISGIGPKLEETLNGLGVFHFDQIAEWSQSEVDWVGELLEFPGRIERENWIEQAAELAKGELNEQVRVAEQDPQ